MSKTTQRIRQDYHDGFRDGRNGYFNQYKGNSHLWSYHKGYAAGYKERQHVLFVKPALLASLKSKIKAFLKKTKVIK